MRRIALFIIGVLVAAACNAPERLSAGEQLVVNTPAGFDFGGLQVGNTSAPHTTTFTYTGFGADTINSVSYSCPDFTVNAALPADVYRTCEPCNPCPTCVTIACCPIDVWNFDFDTTFHPTVGQPVSCPVTFYLASGGTRTVTFSGTGTLPPIQISVQPPSINFGDVRRNTDSSSVSLSVGNQGGSTMTVSSVDISGPFAIMSGPTGAYGVGPGASQGYTLACHPTVTGPVSGNFNVHSNDPQRPLVQIGLNCNGIDSNLDVQPSPAAFATTRVGEPVNTNIALKNSGTAAMSLEGVTVSGTDITMTGGATTGTINPGGTSNVQVHFGATAKGPQSGTVTVTYDGGQQRVSQITAKALGTSMSLTPDGDIDFGPICAGQSKTQTFSILANDEGAFHVSSFANADPAFTVSSPTLPANVLGSGANKVMFDVRASPTAEGPVTSALTINTDIPNTTPRTVNLSVTGIAAGVTPNPATLDFGQNEVNTTTIGQSVHLSNCSPGSITFSMPRIEGPDAGDFAIVAQPESTTVQPAASASWLIVFQGHTAGPKAANFVVDYDGGTATIPLAGEGVTNNAPTDPGTGGIDERSYYTCSSSTGSSGFVTPLLVVALLLWRRRRTRC